MSRAGAPPGEFPPPSAGFEPSAAPDPAASGETIWMDDTLPPGATSHAINDRWNWVTANHWEHRAYWGGNLVIEGIDGGPARRPMGPLPPTGEWVRLEVPASAVDMENRTATGMGFTLFDGRATWDRAGKRRP